MFPFELTVPGGRVRAGGVTVIGILPPYRRRGRLTALMRRQLDDMHERGSKGSAKALGSGGTSTHVVSDAMPKP